MIMPAHVGVIMIGEEMVMSAAKAALSVRTMAADVGQIDLGQETIVKMKVSVPEVGRQTSLRGIASLHLWVLVGP